MQLIEQEVWDKLRVFIWMNAGECGPFLCMNKLNGENMNEWMDKWMNKWKNERMNWRIDKWKNEFVNKWMNKWMSERMYIPCLFRGNGQRGGRAWWRGWSTWPPLTTRTPAHPIYSGTSVIHRFNPIYIIHISIHYIYVDR